MADTISFTCPECAKAYKVAAEYAGRSFNCKQCGYALTVPAVIEPQVEMGSGTAVMRKTDSGRVVPVKPSNNPTQVFVKQRESEVVAPPAPKSKAPLLAGVGVLVLVVAGVGIAAALGVFKAKEPVAAGNAPQTAANKPDEPEKPKITRREDILNRLVAPGQRLPDFIALYRQGLEAKLEAGDIAELAEAVSRAAWDEKGGEMGDDELLALADELKGVRNDVPTDTLRRVVVERHLGKREKPAAWEEAQRLLGREPYDFGKQVERATMLHDSGVLEGADGLREDLLKLEARSIEGWVLKEERTRLREIEGSLDALAAELERIRREDPFRLVAYRVKSEVSKELFYPRGKWQVVATAPVVAFIEVRRSDTEAGARREAERAVKLVKAMLEWYTANIATDFKRTVPTGIEDQAQRDSEPWVLLLFGSMDSWRGYLSENRSLIDTSAVGHFLDHPRGRLSCVFTGNERDMNELQLGAARLAIDSYHPDAPKELDERGAFQRTSSFLLSRYLAECISNVDDADEPKQFMSLMEGQNRAPRMYRSLLKRWRQPFNRDQRGINSFGGPALTAKDVLSLQSLAEVADAFDRNCKRYADWPEEMLSGVVENIRTRANQQVEVARPYCMGLMLFLYNYEVGGKPVYRDRLLKFIRAYVGGSEPEGSQLEVFNRTFGLDDAGWAKLEQQFNEFQEAG
ncbi:MAG: hypothetical protein KF696_09600 [Planctomycetes bacterium]|nr:hypothetical protein [Planctomycetota bacterium]MCW8136111.1 hypothetical protein [Planctomycetota bacterium]